MTVALLAAAVTAGAIGVPLRQWLRAGTYRRCGEALSPASRRWVVPALALVLMALAARLVTTRTWGMAPAYLALAVIGVALTAIDLEVHRLPDALTLRTVPLMVVLLGFASLVHEERAGLVPALICWVGALLIFGGLVLLVPGGMGLGDAKLAALVALVLGWSGYDVAGLGLALGFFVGGLWAMALMLTRRASRHTHFAFGPSILLGGLLAALLATP